MSMDFNYLDIAVVIFIAFFAIKGYLLGFVKMCFGFLPPIASVVAAKVLSPFISTILRGTFIFYAIKNGVSEYIGIDKVIENAVSQSQNNVISGLNLPEFLKNSLLENNNPVVYDILNVSGLEDYISGYIANVCLNALSVVIVFVAVFVALKIILKTMDIISKLPVINLFNSTGGVIAGFVYSVFLLWVIGIVLMFFYSNANFAPFFKLLEDSTVAGFLYENNLLLFLVLGIFA